MSKQHFLRLGLLTLFISGCIFFNGQTHTGLFGFSTAQAGIISVNGVNTPYTAGANRNSFQAQSAVNRPFTTIDQMPYPRVWPNFAISGSGWPFIGSTDKNGTCSNSSTSCAFDVDCGGAKCNNPSQVVDANTPLNQAAIAAVAKYPILFFAPTPATDIRPDLMAALKQANPNAFYMSYSNGGATWCPYSDPATHVNSYPVGSYYRDFYLAVTGGDPDCFSQSDGLLWLQNGTLDTRDSSFNVNLAKHVSDGHGGQTYPIADAIAQTIFNHTIANHQYDAVFLDVFCSGILWEEDGSHLYDYQRAGYGSDNTLAANRTAFDAGWKAGHIEVGRKLRELATTAGYPDLPIIGNCGPSIKDDFPNFSGWMREGFPGQDGGSWMTNMFRDPGGMFLENIGFHAPQLNLVVSAQSPYQTPYSNTNFQRLRFGLGSSALGSSAALFFNSTGSPYSAPDYSQWYDEYGVNLATGRADDTKTGWLGFPKGDAHQMIVDNANPNLISGGNFESGMGSWTFSAGGTSTGTSDLETTDVAQGTQALHTNMTSLWLNPDGSPIDWAAGLASTPITLTSGHTYTVTFWAKTSTAHHQISVFFEKAGTNSVSGHALPINDSWQQYQVVIQPTQTISDSIRFYLGHELGDVWLDDIRVQEGGGSIYRRDFDHGIVLVNGDDGAHTITLEKSFRKILGSKDTVTNNGAEVSQVTLLGTGGGNGTGDALFLIDIDRTAPAAVNNLQAP